MLPLSRYEALISTRLVLHRFIASSWFFDTKPSTTSLFTTQHSYTIILWCTMAPKLLASVAKLLLNDFHQFETSLQVMGKKFHQFFCLLILNIRSSYSKLQVIWKYKLSTQNMEIPPKCTPSVFLFCFESVWCSRRWSTGRFSQIWLQAKYENKIC